MEKSSRYTKGALQRWVHAESRPHGEMAGVIWNDRISLPKGFQAKIVGSVYFYLFNSDVTFLVRTDSKLSLLMSFSGKSARVRGSAWQMYFLGQNEDSSPQSLKIKLLYLWWGIFLPKTSTVLASSSNLMPYFWVRPRWTSLWPKWTHQESSYSQKHTSGYDDCLSQQDKNWQFPHHLIAG